MRAALFAFLAAGLTSCATAPTGPAPDVVFKELTGKVAPLSQYRGSVVLLDFWATWCEPCRDSLPLYEKLYENPRMPGFVVLGVSEDEPTKDLDAFSREHRITYPFVRDPGRAAYRAFGVRDLPTAFLLGADGRILKRWDGFHKGTLAEVEAALDALKPKK
jgi:peroxiredoxin